MNCKFNAHQWEEIGRVFVRPVYNINGIEVEGDGVDTFERLAMGVTSIELRCTRCKTLMEKQLLGDHTKEGR